jgi:hypothetical protein
MDIYDNIQYYHHIENDDIYAVLNYHEFSFYLDCYSVVGQHSEVHKGYINESKRLNKNNKLVQDLKSELKNIGYKFV